mgnify:CR=1 FL=1
MVIDDNKKLEVLHDHYKESFLYIREREKQRDRLFMFVIALIGLLWVEIQYSYIFPGVLRNIKLEFVELNVSIMPISVFLDITWTYLFVVVLKYCQVSINIEGQYNYLHNLEEKISNFFQDEKIYCREGKAYLDNYPLFSNLVWMFYVFFFPQIVIISTILIIYFEWSWIPLIHEIAKYHLIYDSVLALGITLSFFFYRLLPMIKSIFSKK